MSAEVPLAGPDALKAQVAEGFAASAESYDVDGREFFGQVGRWLVQAAQVRAEARVLDVGCGKGAASLPAAQAVGPRGQLIGIDLAVPMLTEASDRAQRAGLANVRFEEGDAEDPGACPSCPPDSFDVVLAANVLQFLPRPAGAVANWLPVLRAGGIAAVAWLAGEEARWAPVIAAVDAHVPDGVPAFGAFIRRPPFGAISAVEEMLTRAGYANVATVTRPVTIVYNGIEQWWISYQTQGPWALSWRHILPGRLTQAKWDASTLLGPMREADGSITRTMTFAFTVGRKAVPPAALRSP